MFEVRPRSSPNVGIEPTTLGLRVSCSNDCASRASRNNFSEKYAVSLSWFEKFWSFVKTKYVQNDLPCLRVELRTFRL